MRGVLLIKNKLIWENSMKKSIGVLLLIVSLFSISTSVLAHPGNTDGSGGHTCRTNCTEKWGLNYGEYHYHNGGGSDSSSSSDSQPSYNAQAERDNGYDSGYKKGYELGYKEAYDESADFTYDTIEYKEGWESGFDEGFSAGIAQIELEKVQKEELNLGIKDGQIDGDKAFTEGKTKVEYIKTNYVSDSYEQGYITGFSKGWETGKEKKKYYDLGLSMGYKQDNQVLPTDTKNADLLNKFKSGFEDGVKKRDSEIIKVLDKEGFDDGIALQANKPSNESKDAYKLVYRDAYTKGKDFRREQVIDEGHKLAFQSLKVNIPNEYKENKELQEWYLYGYENNDLATEIKEVAFEDGKSFFDSKDEIPEKYKEGEKIYQLRFAEGIEIKEDRMNIAQNSLVGLGAVGASGGAYVILKKRKKKKV